MELRPRTPSDGQYELTTELLDPLVVPPDAEPNDEPGFARAAPATLAWSGRRTGADQDVDAVWLPALESAGPVIVSMTGDGVGARLFVGETREERVDLERGEEDGTFVAQEPPVGRPLYLEVWADGAYDVRLEAPGWTPADPVAPLALDGTVELETHEVAAYWPEGQHVSGSVQLTNTGSAAADLELEATTSHYAWHPALGRTAVTIDPGASVDIPLELEIDPDVWADALVTVRLLATGADGASASFSAAIDATTEAPAAGSHVGWTVPDALLGGLNVAGAAVGGAPAGTSPRPEREPMLFDDLTPPRGGFRAGPLPMEVEVDLAGDAPVLVAGTILNPLAGGSSLEQTVRDFEFDLSEDGMTWQTVLQGELERIPIDQSFVLETPMPATRARLRILSTHGRGNDRAAVLGEWKVVAEPGTVPDGMSADIADPVRGGHVARSLPSLGNWDRERQVLDDDLHRNVYTIPREGIGAGTFDLVIGFQEGRAAQIDGLTWTDPEGSKEDQRLDAVRVETSLDGPLGPWTPLGEWQLTRAANGSVSPFDLAQPVWARYVRLSADLDPESVRQLELPGRIEVLERAPDETYRSILGEWGYISDAGPYEWSVSTATAASVPDADAGDTMDAATPLAIGETRTDTAEVLEDEDWYRIDVPLDANTMRLDLEGLPTVGVELQLLDASGNGVASALHSLPGGRRRYEVDVEPGATYYARVEQPPFNLVFTFDTSGSMGPYLDYVFEGMREFAADVLPGRELVKILPFDEDPLLDVWTDQPEALQDAVDDYVPIKNSSDMLGGLLVSSQMLADREGTRAILVVGDGETGIGEAPELWAAIEDVGPTIFGVHVGADTAPEETRNMIRAWTDANGGSYQFPTTHAEMDRAFERMSTRLRRPSLYSLTASTEFVDRRPGPLTVVAPPDTPLALAPDTGISILFDTSSSMRKKAGDKTRIAIAKGSLRELFREMIPEGTPVAIRVFGGAGKGQGCTSHLDVPLAPLDRRAALRWVKQVSVPRKAATPIAEALQHAPEDLAGVGNRIIVLITDGKENCGGDPLATAREIEAAGTPVVLNIVGFALGDEGLKADMADWAGSTGGSYFDASNAAELKAAMKAATGVPFDVYAPGVAGPVASGTVGGLPPELSPGTYRLEVHSDPPITLDDVVIVPEAGATVTLQSEGAPDS